jgi:hypothetical protein
MTENDAQVEWKLLSNRAEIERFYDCEEKKWDVRWQNECTSLGKEGRERNKSDKISINVTLKLVRITITAVEGKKLLHILSMCLELWLYSRQSSCAVLYCHVRPVCLYYIFPHYLKKRHDFREKGTERKMWNMIFSTILSETFLILRRTERDMNINVRRCSFELPAIVLWI